ncbi:MAG TPA: DoxX family protein [Candidatus Angelobacter sp.]|nr:DoxX family protein [Candidatus Angelobacter sp.]
MQSDVHAAPISPGRLWAGRIMSGLVILFLLMDAIMKFVKPVQVTEAMAKLGYPESLTATLGAILLVSVIVYAIPSTSVLGAILLTGYLGGAVATHVRVGDPLFSHALFPVYMGILLWGGLVARDPRLGNFLPFRK